LKKTEHILGIVAASMFLVGTLLRIMHLPASGMLHAVSVLIFNFGYFPLQLIRGYRMVSSLLDRSYLVYRFITLFIVMFGFVFKIQHWPGAGLLLLLGTYLIPLFIVFYFYMRIKGKGIIPFRWSDLIITVVAYMIYFYVTRTMVSPNVVDGYVVLEEQYSELNTGLIKANQLIYSGLDSATVSGNEELLQSIRELREISTEMHHITDSLKAGFISSFYSNPLGDDFDLSTANRSLLASPVESHFYFMESTRGAQYKFAIRKYMKEVKQIQQRHHLPATVISTGFDLDDFTNRWGETYTWEARMFNYAPLASVFTNLSWIKQVVLLTERGTQSQLTSLLTQAEMFRVLEDVATMESKHAMELKENEILRIRQQKELQRIRLEKSETELSQRNTVTATALAGIVFVLILLTISSRAYLLKQKDNKILGRQKDEISGKNKELSMRNEEIMAQRDEIEAQRDEIEAQRNMVFKQKEEMVLTHNEISSSIDYAMRLQDAILPGPTLLEKHFSGHLIFYRPKQKVSGDFYWWTQLGDSLVIAVADCTGHGVPGAFMSLLGASLLKEIVNREGISNPGRILDRLREEVIAALNQKGATGEQKDGMDMAVISINPGSLKCKYAGANNPLYLLRRSKLSIYRPSPMPISHYEEMHPFETIDIQLEANDQLYLFSDGYVDQFGGKNRKKFKYKAFRQVITEHADLSMSRQQQVFSDTIREWQSNNEQTDDMVIVGIRI